MKKTALNIVALLALSTIVCAAQSPGPGPLPGLIPSNNLSDVPSPSTGLSNLGGIATAQSGAANGVAPLDASANVPLANLGNVLSGLDNRVINGDFGIDDYQAGASITPSTTAFYFTNRWFLTSTQNSKVAFQQNSGAHSPITRFYMVATAQAAVAIGAADEFLITQKIEAPNIYDFSWNANGGKSVQVAFYVKASIVGPFCVAIHNNGRTASYVHQFAYPSAGVWQLVQYTVPAPTGSGTWYQGPGSYALELGFDMGAGSNFQTTADTWAAGNYTSTSGCTQLLATNGASYNLTNVRVYPASSPIPYVPRSYAAERGLAARYYNKSFVAATKPAQNAGATGAVTFASPFAQVTFASATFPVTFPSPMMAAPTMTFFSTTAASANCYDNTAGADAGAASAVNTGDKGFGLKCTMAAGDLLGDQLQVHYTAQAEL